MKQNKGFREYESAHKYYLAHPELHKLSRTQLARTDDVLYRHLLKERAMRLVIPQTLIGQDTALSQDEVRKIIEAHSSSGGNPHIAAKQTRHSYSTVIKYWARGNLQTCISQQPSGTSKTKENSALEDKI